MRPPSRFSLSTLFAALAALSIATVASAGNVDAAKTSDPLAFRPISRAEIEDASASAHARIDQRLNVLLTGPTTMDCSNDLDAGFETCIVRAQGTPSSPPAELAKN